VKVALGLVAAGALGGLVGCVTPAPAIPSAAPPSLPEATAFSMATTAHAMVGSSRDEVAAALGPATIVRFDSGYEVWVYRFVEPAAPKQAEVPAGAAATRDPSDRRRRPGELVMLFAPSGVVTKVRVRAEEPAS
jgi:hypothetical protein